MLSEIENNYLSRKIKKNYKCEQRRGKPRKVPIKKIL